MRDNERADRSVSRRVAVRAAGAAALGGAALGALATVGTAEAAPDHPPIVGTWRLTTGQSTSRSNFLVLMFFFPGGIVQYADAPQRPTNRSSDAGTVVEYQSISGGQWLQTGFNEYTFTTIGIDYDAQGVPVTIDTTRGTATYDPLRDQWSAPITLTETDLNGTVLGTITGTVTGTRVGATA